MAIKAEEKTLMKIFSDDYLFEIPSYQRPYAWTTEQTWELLDDIMTAMDTVNTSEPPEYFLGSIVLIKDMDQPLSRVIDGQQRLTTLTILFCILRELSEEKEDRESLHKRVCEKGDKYEGTRDRFRLNLRERDRDFFESNVQKPGNLQDFLNQDGTGFKDSRRRMHENAGYLWEKLSTVEQEKRDRLALFINQKCYLVVVSASDQNSAYRIFSVMNDRGLDLSPTDILKADIIGKIKDEMRHTYTSVWEEIEEDLGREDFRELFAHIRMIYAKNKARRSLNQEFAEGVLSKVNGDKFIDDVLRPMAEAYGVVSRAAYESAGDAETVNSYLRHLGRLDNFDWVPPAVAFFDRNRNDKQALMLFTRDLERLAYALFILRSNINDRINRYAGVLRGIEQGDDLCSCSSPLQLSEEERSSVLRALDGPVYPQTRVCMTLLLRLDGLLAESVATYERKVLSVEHVLPQTPAEGSDWLGHFPDPEQRDMWTHRLANLVLLSRRKNSQAWNLNFERKKSEYFQREGVTPFALTATVLSQQQWTPEVLEERQAELIRRLKDEWRL